MGMAQVLLAQLATGKPLWDFPDKSNPAYTALNTEMRFLTAKPVIYLANVDENGLATGSPIISEARQYTEQQGLEFLMVCAKLEEDIIEFAEDEKSEYLKISGIVDRGLDRVIQSCYRLLGLISFFTFNDQEVRAWTIKSGSTAPRAAGQIHTDFERGFIRADVAAFDIFAANGGWSALKAAGLLRSEGREYQVQDGDVIYFRFNV
jgi:ribosome-binding ATPase YchF (GTP1/OBG family)